MSPSRKPSSNLPFPPTKLITTLIVQTQFVAKTSISRDLSLSASLLGRPKAQIYDGPYIHPKSIMRFWGTGETFCNLFLLDLTVYDVRSLCFRGDDFRISEIKCDYCEESVSKNIAFELLLISLQVFNELRRR